MMGREPDAMAARPHSLPPPDDEEVERLLRTVALRVIRLFRKQGKRPLPRAPARAPPQHELYT